MKKIILFTLGLGLLVVLPARAELGNVLADFQSYSVDLQNYIKNNLTSTLKPLEMSSSSALNEATGELNVPNPVAAGDRLRNVMVINSISDKFDNNPVVNSSTANYEINRLITRSSVDSILGKNGQIMTKVKLQETENTLKNITQIAQEADRNHQNFLSGFQNQIAQLGSTAMPGLGALMNSSQNQSDLQLQMLKIQSQQSKLVGETLAQTMQVNHFLQYSNLNLANISQQMDENSRARRVDSSAEAARLLRATSQMDLFGRKELTANERQ